MSQGETDPAGESLGEKLAALAYKYQQLAIAHNGEIDTFLDLATEIRVEYIPAGLLGMMEPELEDEPDNLADRVVISITESKGDDIEVEKEFDISLASALIDPDLMVQKEVYIVCEPVNKAYRKIIGASEPEEVMRNHPSFGTDEALDDAVRFRIAPKSEEIREAIKSQDPEVRVFLPFQLTSTVLNPGFLEKFGAPTEIVELAWKVAEAAAAEVENLAFTIDDVQLLKQCLEKLEITDKQ